MISPLFGVTLTKLEGVSTGRIFGVVNILTLRLKK